MTQLPNNPSSDPRATPPSQALRVARLAIALVLVVGIAVFAVFAFEELKAGAQRTPPPTDFGAADTAPTGAPIRAAGPNPLAGLSGTDPAKYPLILRANPHPGEIPPFLNTAPLGQPPYQQRAGGEVWEFCVYEVPDASLTDLIAHYDGHAKRMGLRLAKQAPTSENLPGGLVASWTNGSIGLQVTASPLTVTQPVQPPLAPPTPLRWVVKYSYPDRSPAP